MSDKCIACELSGSDEAAYMAEGCPKCMCRDGYRHEERISKDTYKKSTHDNLAFDEFWEQYKLKKINSTYTLMDVAEEAWQAAISSNLHTVTSSKYFDEWFNTEPNIKGREGYSDWDKTIMKAAFDAGRHSVILPERRPVIIADKGTTTEWDRTPAFDKGWNGCLDAIHAANPDLKE